jgi:dTDP-4-amino-4,6-dideoxygalactose transaminase
MNFETITKFEERIAEFYGAPFAVATDSCTHALELAIRYCDATSINVPKRTYISVPLLSKKIGIGLSWREQNWVDFYYIHYTIVDAAVLWKPNSYIPGTFMCLSFQHQKHLSLGRGGMILCDDEKSAQQLKKMSYDGRIPTIPWREQNISTMGYHYYMTPETAQNGLDILDEAIIRKPKQWTINDWPDLTQMDIFK